MLVLATWENYPYYYEVDGAGDPVGPSIKLRRKQKKCKHTRCVVQKDWGNSYVERVCGDCGKILMDYEPWGETLLT